MPIAPIRWNWTLPAVIEPDPLPGLNLPLPLRSLLMRRGYDSEAGAAALLNPPTLPEPTTQFPDLEVAVERVAQICRQGNPVAICGDYDADGMTSSALLKRSLSLLGAKPSVAIPSRADDGYGLNPRMVRELHQEGIRLLITVDNGVSAAEALAVVEQLGMEVIVTDHHTIPDQRPPMTALIHPATTPDGSPYRGLAGVGLAFVLAKAVAERLDRPDAIRAARDLFCIGTVADMAPLLGANRLWLQEGLQHLHRSDCAGLRALQRLAGLENRPLRCEDIGFQLAPRINAVGRLGEPRLVVDLLTAEEDEVAMGLARRCDDFNRQRRDLCDAIEAEAVALVEADSGAIPPFLLLAQSHWHHGVIGIVAARLVERYHRPSALLAAEGDGRMRASVRSPRGFAVDQALRQCACLLERHGGHPAAGGFTVLAKNVPALHDQLNALASSWLDDCGDAHPVEPEALLTLREVDWELWNALQLLEPFGVGHESPLFWTRDCVVVEQRRLNGGHLALTLQQGDTSRRAIAWRWRDEEPVPQRIDVAFRLSLNRWQGDVRIQLEMKALRQHSDRVWVQRGPQRYLAERHPDNTVVLRNAAGKELQATAPAGMGLTSSDPLVDHPQVRHLLEEACLGLGLRP